MSIRKMLFRAALEPRLRRIEKMCRQPLETQRRQFRALVAAGGRTRFGAEHGIGSDMSYGEFCRRVPVVGYEEFRPWIERMLAGERDVTAAGRVDRFARSSGTTSTRSKYLPVTRRSRIENHLRGMVDVAALYLAANPATRVFEGKTLTLGGTCGMEQGHCVGDLSGLLLSDGAVWNNWFRVPDRKTALLADFDRKCEEICRLCAGERITAFAGVPSWNMVLLRRILEKTGKENLLEVWPDMELFVHGGMSFAPYRRAYEELIPSSGMHYMQTYNASEGFFAIGDRLERDDMLLMLDYGTWLEFRSDEGIVPLEGVEAGRDYALVITSSNGLWRYEIGDVVHFTSTDPYRIRFGGRTREFINAFGEELIVDNADKALQEVCKATGAVVSEYTVAPRFMTLEGEGGHDWAVEFHREPPSVEVFAALLDQALRSINSDYDAKRRSTIGALRMVALPRGTFVGWLQRKGKNKVPRMVGDRHLLEEITTEL